MSEEIGCPKCGSTQLTTNEKGFSGGKAVAGAVLTGGIGLLAGFHGKNKIIITCLACGKKFKPGEGKIIKIPIVSQTFVSQETTSIPEISDIDHHIIELIQAGTILAAVKYYKEQTGVSLKDAKDYVDNFTSKNGVKPKTGCFIATACYGDYDAPEVKILRKFRDGKLLNSKCGKIFIKTYYIVSPPLAFLISKSNFLKKNIRHYFLRPLINKLKKSE
ncbi:MAG: CFI-box-CTERM domain-containing protein [Bacteroidales bacterium]